jgi:predicted ferric reductase
MTSTQAPITATSPTPPRTARAPDVATLALILLWTGAVAVIALWWFQEPEGAGGQNKWLIGGATLAGLLAGYTCALLVAMMARLPILENHVGSDRLARWHAMLGRYTMFLLIAHIALFVWAFTYSGRLASGSLWETIADQFTTLTYTVIGTVAMLVVGFVSVRALQRRMRYEIWYYLHLATYAAIYMAFIHQVSGPTVGRTVWARAIWYALYLGVAVLVLWYRAWIPVRINLRHRLVVESVTVEAPGVWSVLIRGKHLDQLAPQPGQFCRWRFLAPHLRWTSSPYSLSGAPAPDLLRITMKEAGTHSAAIATLSPGTRVWVEGPYGAMTAARRQRRKVLLIGGGIGVTPLCTLFETLPSAPGELTLLYRAHSAEDLVMWDELSAIATAKDARLLSVLNAEDGTRVPLTADLLRSLVPDIDVHDVYLCGPAAMADAVWEALRAADVPARHIHEESYSW